MTFKNAFFIFLFGIYSFNSFSSTEVNCGTFKKETKRYFSKKINTNISVDDYFQLPVSEFRKAGQFDYLVFKLKSQISSKKSNKLFVTIQDNLSENYWSQLNHVVEVQKGESVVYVDLKQLVGERGSQKKPRRINFKKIKKAFLVLNPDKRGRQKINVSQFYFLSSMHPKYHSGVKVFDFRVKNQTELPCITSVDENDVYTPGNGYGFKQIKVWKKEDSQYLDPFLSSVVYARSGEFIVDLENGVYDVTFYWNSLGYWEPPFFTRRRVLAEDIPLLIEDRSRIADYEKDFFVFENREPTVSDHPWDWLYTDVMKPISKRVTIKDKKLNLTFSGDASAVGLNGLIISKANNDSEKEAGKEFMGQFKDFLRSHYSRKVRSSYEGKKAWRSKKAISRLTQEVNPLNPFKNLAKVKTDVSQVLFSSNKSSFINLQIQVPFEGNAQIRWRSKSDDNKVKVIGYKGKYMWVSLDRNHESYTLETQVLKKGIYEVKPSLNQQFVIEFSGVGGFNQKIYEEKGELEVVVKSSTGKKKVEWKFPLKVVIWNQKFPALDIQVGFIGLNNLRYSFFPNRDKLEKRRYWDRAYLKLLAKYGFNSFTGLPTSYVDPVGLSYDEVEKFLKYARKLGFKPPFYTYGGEFLHRFFENNNLVGIQKEKKTLNEFLKNPNFSDIVFQFSDEAAGYSNNVSRDLKRASFLKENFRTLRLGGFTHWKDKNSGSLVKLNKAMDIASFSEIGFSALNWLGKSERSWGLYNQAQGSRENPYKTFGRKLWKWSRKPGFSHYLEWHSSAIQNLPYFDLDGREADVAIAFPGSGGDLSPTIKFIKSTEGLQDFLWLSTISSQAAFDAKNFMKIGEKFRFRQSLIRLVR